MALTAAELVARVSTVGVDQATGQLTRMGLVTDDAGGKFAKLATLGAGVLAVGLVAVGVKSAEMAGNFQQAVNRLRTGAGDTQDSFSTLANGILSVSVATGQMSDQLTPAMYEILSSGQRGAQAFDTLSAAAKGAVIEQANVKDVSDTLSGTMTNFGTKTFGASQYMNGLIKAVSLGRVTLQNLSTAMGPIEPVAHAMGVSFADLSAAMSVQTNAAIPATRAATGLRFMLQALEVPTGKAKDAMAAFGLSSVAVGNEMKKSLPDALQMIYNAAKKAGPEGSVPFNRAVSDMVGGQRSLGAFLALTGGHMKDFVADTQKISGAMKAGSGDVNGWAIAQSNFNVIMDKAKAVVQAAAINLGLLLLPALGKLVGLVPQLVGYISNFSAHANVLIPVIAGLVGFAIVPLTVAMWGLASAVITATWPFLLIGAAVAGLVAIFMHFYSTNAGFKAFIDNLVVGFKQVASLIMANFIPAMIQVGNWLRTNVLPILQQIGQFLLATFAPVWKQLADVWNGQILPALKQLWAALQPLMPLFKLIGAIIAGVVIVAFGLMIGILTGVIKAVAGLISGLAVAIGGIVQIFSGLVQIISGIVRVIYDIVTGNFKDLGAALGQIWQGIVTMFTGVWNVIKGIFMAAWGVIYGLVSGFVQGIIGFFTMLYHALVGGSIVPDMVLGIVRWFASLPGRAFGLIAGFVLGVVNFFLRLAQQAGAAIQRFVLMAVSLFVSLASQLIARAASLVAGVIGWLLQLPGRAAGAMASLASTVLGALSRLAGQALSAGANIVRNIASGILGAIGSAIGGAMNAVGSFIHDHLPHSPAKLGPLRDLHVQAAMISQQIAEGIAAGSPKIQAAMGSLLKPVSMQVSGSFTPGASRYSFPLAGGQPTIVVNVASPDVNLDGWRVTDRLMPHIASKIRYNTPGGMGR